MGLFLSLTLRPRRPQPTLSLSLTSTWLLRMHACAVRQHAYDSVEANEQARESVCIDRRNGRMRFLG